jgi:hypothetical protein
VAKCRALPRPAPSTGPCAKRRTWPGIGAGGIDVLGLGRLRLQEVAQGTAVLRCRLRHGPSRNEIEAGHDFGDERRQKRPVPAEQADEHPSDRDVEQVVQRRKRPFDKHRGRTRSVAHLAVWRWRARCAAYERGLRHVLQIESTCAHHLWRRRSAWRRANGARRSTPNQRPGVLMECFNDCRIALIFSITSSSGPAQHLARCSVASIHAARQSSYYRTHPENSG